jgi:hypothetical protein
MVLRRIFGPRRYEVTGEWRRLHKEDLNDLYSSPNIVRVIKSRRMRWAGHVARLDLHHCGPAPKSALHLQMQYRAVNALSLGYRTHRCKTHNYTEWSVWRCWVIIQAYKILIALLQDYIVNKTDETNDEESQQIMSGTQKLFILVLFPRHFRPDRPSAGLPTIYVRIYKENGITAP